MKIVIISEWFSENMGYAENYLPKALGKLGHEVHLITSDLQIYGTSKEYNRIYEKYLGPAQVPQGVFSKVNFTLHRNAHSIDKGIKILGLEKKLKEIQPDIVYCFGIDDWITNEIVKLKNKFSYKVFCESRIHKSIFTPPNTFSQKIRQWRVILNGRKLAKKIDKYYPVAPDVMEVITKYFGVPNEKCELSSLAVETDIFHPLLNASEIEKFRNKLGYSDDDIVCLYTGRFTDSKGPLILAKAINHLQNNGHARFKGLFVGQGDDNCVFLIKNSKGCQIHSFVGAEQLAKFYQSFDIGVWPLEESTSQLDAVACGMPVIVNNTVEDKLRFEGNGLQFKKNDFIDLAEKILSIQEKQKRIKMGLMGSEKIKNHLSWDHLAKRRLLDFAKTIQA